MSIQNFGKTLSIEMEKRVIFEVLPEQKVIIIINNNSF